MGKGWGGDCGKRDVGKGLWEKGCRKGLWEKGCRKEGDCGKRDAGRKGTVPSEGKVMQEGDCGKTDVGRDYGESDTGRKGTVGTGCSEGTVAKRDAGRGL